MASSSSTMSCFHCHNSATARPIAHPFRNGWRLHSGAHALLCSRCASAYEEGRFCETFHSNDDGWRDCESCGKLVHCGCVVSFNTHLLLDFGGIICMECSRFNFQLARKRCRSIEHEIGAQEPYEKPSLRGPMESHFWPRVTALELQNVSRNPKATVTPIFEKILSDVDADLKLACLIIPKQCAETHFPDVSGSHNSLLKIQDTEGSEWEFHYRYSPNGESGIYVLEGLRDYIVAKKWQPGDTVTFYQVEPGRKIVMGLRKTSAGHSFHESMTNSKMEK